MNRRPDVQAPRETRDRKTLLRAILRFGLGTLILATGLGKLLDLSGFVTVVETYRLGLSIEQAWVGAILVTAVELGIGAWLISGWRLQSAALAAACLNCIWLVMLTGALLRGLELQNCGCFGVFFARPLEWYSPLEDLVLILACLWLARLAARPSWFAGAPAVVRKP
jgi:uncharacterized membrane protein YphA (DoxX/SURF4 family)